MISILRIVFQVSDYKFIIQSIAVRCYNIRYMELYMVFITEVNYLVFTTQQGQIL